MKVEIPLLTLVLPTLLAGLVLSYVVLVPNSSAYFYIAGTFLALGVCAFLMTRQLDLAGSNSTVALLLSAFYCGTSLFLGFLIAFVLRVREAPWTMHVKDPGFGILIPLMTVGGLSLVVGIVSLVILIVRLRP